MKHRTVVCGTRGGRRGWETERAVHVTQEEFWDKAETPAKVELAEDVEQAVVFGARERYFGREVTRPVEICGGVGHGGRLGRGGFFGFGVGGRNALRAETPDGSGSMVFEVGFLELKGIVSGRVPDKGKMLARHRGDQSEEKHGENDTDDKDEHD